MKQNNEQNKTTFNIIIIANFFLILTANIVNLTFRLLAEVLFRGRTLVTLALTLIPFIFGANALPSTWYEVHRPHLLHVLTGVLLQLLEMSAE